MDWITSYLEMVGSIPTQIGLCTTLSVLELYVENIKGTLPTEIANLDLQSLHLGKYLRRTRARAS